MRQRSGPTKFLVDAMLGSLSRKLRAFGFDVVYYNEGSDASLLELCRRQRRVLVTADRSLAKRSERLGVSVLSVSGAGDRERVRAMVAAANRLGLALKTGEPRCSLCNGSLSRISPLEARKTLPASVARRHRSFYRCSACGHLYWKGGHWKKLRRLERLFESRP